MNIITIFTDQHRHDLLGCAGHSLLKTPNINTLASEGVLFENAFCCSTLCVPSRTSFFTGQYIHRTKSIFNDQDSHISIRQESFVKSLKKNGYKLGLIGKNHCFNKEFTQKMFDSVEQYTSHGKNLGRLRNKDKEVYQFRRNSQNDPVKFKLEGLIDKPEPFQEEECITARVAQDAVEFIKARDKNSPFFLYLSFPDPHFPNLVCEPYFSMYDPDNVKMEGVNINWDEHPFKHFVQSQASGYDSYTKEERKKILAIYYGQITFIDKAVGRVLKTLDEEQLQNDTIVVFTADHGDFAGNYGLIGKTGGFYESLIRIPLIIRIPNNKTNGKTKANVSNIDIMPTIFDYIGLTYPKGVQGKSFLEIITEQGDIFREEIYAEVGKPELPPKSIPKENYKSYNKKRSEKDKFWFIEYTTRGRSVMVRKNGWKYCYNTGDKEELYNYEKDSLELFNLAEKSEFTYKKNELKNNLLEWLLEEPVKNKPFK